MNQSNLPPRRVPLAVKDKLQAELEILSSIEIIAKVDDPTDWISSLVVTTKRNGKVRLYLHPKPLNNTLKRNHYPCHQLKMCYHYYPMPNCSQSSMLETGSGMCC